MDISVGWLVFALLLGPVLILVHELGHAAAVVLLTGKRTVIEVGAGQRYAGLQFGRVSIRLFGNDKGGQCVIPPSATPRDTFLIALAGPAASAVAAVVLAGAIVTLGRWFEPYFFLGLGFVTAAAYAILNLLPQADGESHSDGWVAREVWRRWHGTAEWRIPMSELEDREIRETFEYKLLTSAAAEAHASGAPQIDTEHVLIALAGWESEAGRVLREAGLRQEQLRGALEPDREPRASEDRLTPRVRWVLQEAPRHLSLRGDPELAAEHVLLALLHERDERALELLERFGTSPASLNSALVQAMAGAAQPRRLREAASSTEARPFREAS